MLGDRASLVCVVRKLGNYTVSWIYKPANLPERVKVLTSGPEVFSSDQRWKIKVSSTEVVVVVMVFVFVVLLLLVVVVC